MCIFKLVFQTVLLSNTICNSISLFNIWDNKTQDLVAHGTMLYNQSNPITNQICNDQSTHSNGKLYKYGMYFEI